MSRIESIPAIEIDSCAECSFLKYFRCHGNDCIHPSAAEIPAECDLSIDCEDCPLECGRKIEPLAENREGDFPKWCPLEKKG